MDIETQKMKERITILLMVALNLDEQNKGGFSETQAKAWQKYDDALSDLGKHLASKS